MKKQLLDRFLRYVKIDTQSDENSEKFPSTDKQLILAKTLKEELESIGMTDVRMDKYGYVTATLPENTDKIIPVIGFLAHYDTAPDMSGSNVKPQVIEQYNGEDIIISKDLDIVLRVNEFPEMKEYKGQTIITASGNSLLGADDKAGIAEIMTAMDYLVKHPELKHGTIKVAFTPDEEIGKGVDYFDVQKFGANYAYTVDGGPIGELEFENFNAASAKIKIKGRNIHPGYAKDKMINALLIATEINEKLPANQRPELTEKYEGFFHITQINGTVEEAEVQYIIRDHDKAEFENKKKLIQEIINSMNKRFVQPIIQLELKDQYYNMREKIEPVMHIMEQAKQAMIETGVKPEIKPVRGGTDGARLSYMGLPCPNIFTGGHNYHGKYEYAVLESMEKSVEVIIKIIENAAKTK
ncbi:MAG: peptidase T [Bacteroidales bacterium]